MSKPQNGDKVKVHYTGQLEDGQVFDSSRKGEPLEFTLGAGQVIPRFEAAVADLEPGSAVRVTIASDEAYGPHQDALVQSVERGELPEGLVLEVGTRLQARTPEGKTVILRVTELSDSHAMLDANHPLAGQDLTFDIELVANA